MKYSIGFSDRKRSSLGVSRRKSLKRNYGRGVSSFGFERFKNVKKYTNKNIGSKVPKRNTRKGEKNPEFKKRVKKVLYIGLGVLFFLGCAGLIGLGIYLKKLGSSLPSPDQLVERRSDQSTQILDRNGNLLYTIYGTQNREFVSIDKIPEQTRKALLAAEDAEFYQHRGLDYLGILKSLIQNLRGGRVVRGASTLTQQLVKNTLLVDIIGDEAYERTLSRKIKEMLITMQVEQSFTKDQILQMYMNEVPLGGVNYGFQAAANSYFGKDVSELTLAESAMLAGLIQSPGAYSPLFGSKPEMSKVRQNYVLDQLEQKSRIFGISKEDIEAARNEELVYKARRVDIKSPHFVFYVKGELENEFGVERVEKGGLKVTTTLDPTLQGIAEEELVKGVQAAAKKYNANNGAMVVLNPKNGQVLSMVGSVDYWNIEDPRVDGNVNITTSMRQMGSSVKPFVYLNAIQRGYGPWLLTPDINNISFGNYKPKNWDGHYSGLITARQGLVQSRNIPTIYALQVGGIDNYLQLMQKFGISEIENKASYGLSLGLGSAEMRMLELANAYSVFANSGIKHDIVSVLKVEDSKGNVLKEAKDDEGVRVLDEKEAYVANWMICDINEFKDRYGANYFYINGKKLCGKTGTTDGPKDLIAFQYNQSLVVGAWNGNNNNIPMPGAWSSTVSLGITNAFFRRVIDTYNEFNFNRPAGIMTTSVCKDTGASPAEGVECSKESSIYIAGRAPQVDNRKAIEVCADSNVIPNNLEAAKRYGLTATKMLLTTTLENSLQVDAYRSYLSGTGSYIFDTPQSGTCSLPLGPDNAPVVEIYKPTANQQISAGSTVEITGSVRFLDGLSSFSVMVNNNPVSGVNVNTVNADGTFLVNYVAPSSPGTYSIVVYAKDTHGKSDSKNTSVVIPTSAVVTITKPNNNKITKGGEIIASVTGGTASQLNFSISELGDIVGTSGLGGWSANFPNNAQVGKSYMLIANATVSGNLVKSSPVKVTVVN